MILLPGEVDVRTETEAALAAVGVALDLMARRPGADRVTAKGDGRDLVTETDVTVEDAVRAALLERFPEWTVVGEERGGEDRVGDRPYWLVDPICGTRNFASDVPLYAVNVALVERGRVTLAAVGDGGRGVASWAERGRGAFEQAASGPRRLRADGATNTIGIDPGAEEPSPHIARAAEFARAAILTNRWFVRMIGTSLSFAHVAAGKVSAHLIFKASRPPVHTAAGCLLAEEAGALVTDHRGRPWDLSTTAFLAAATPELQAELLGMLADLD
jgi:myo-inositol-1(or 4)-monophosphatase